MVQRRSQLEWAAWVAILSLAFVLRLTGLNWDGGYLLHPDERFLALVAVDRITWPGWQQVGTLLDAAHSPLNPRSIGDDGLPQAFAYGSLPLYVVNLADALVGHLLDTSASPYIRLVYVGRALSAVVDVLTVLVSMALARQMFGQRAALLTGLLLAATVALVQQAHFFVVDPWATMFTTATLAATVKLAVRRSPAWAMLAGIAFGAALATKASIVALAVPPFLVILEPLRQRYGRADAARTAARLLVSFAGFAALTFSLFEPYALLSPRPYVDDLLLQWRIATGAFEVPYTLQYVGTTPVLYQVEQLVKWGVGPGLGVACLVAIPWATRRWWRTRDAAHLILLVWIAVYSASIFRSETKYLRYLLPLIPALAVLASGMLVKWVETQRRWVERVCAGTATTAVVLITIGWALAFVSIYARPHTRVQASVWMLEHIPAGATVGVEHWDDALPLALREVPGATSRYQRVWLTLYDVRPNEQAFEYLASALEQVDYIVLSSDRLAGSIPRVPWRYPVVSEYYRLLETGQLGFQLVYEGRSLPHLGPLTIDDRHADESFTVYDHPRVRIYRKVQPLTREELRERFAWALAQPFVPTRERPAEYRARLGQPVSSLPVAGDVGWSTPVTRSPVMSVVWWAIGVTLLGLSVAPLALRLFGGFPDGGVGFARLLGLLLSGYVAWLLASLRLLPFTMPYMLLSVAIVAVLAAAAARLLPRHLALRSRTRLVFVLSSEAAFWIGFGFFLALRALYPDLWHPYLGGEKPMELAYINAIARSPYFPPYDPWFADGTMSYYYYGFYLSAYLWKLTGVAPDVAFQLTVATVAGLLASGLFSLGAALGRRLSGSNVVSRRATIGTGAACVVLGLFTGNLDALLQLLTQRTTAIDFWRSSRVVDNAITEFPYFSFLWADLHPHVIAQPLIVLLTGLLCSRWTLPVHPAPARIWLQAGIACLTAGSIAVTNTWDAPLAAVLLLLFAAAPLIRNGVPSFRRLLSAVLATLALTAAAWFLFRPFYTHFDAQVGGIAPTSSGTPAHQYLVQFGILLGLTAAAGIWWLARQARSLDSTGWQPVLFGLGATVGGYGLTRLVLPILQIPAQPVDWTAVIVAASLAAASPYVAKALVHGDLGDGELLLATFLLNAGAGSLLAVRPTAAMLLIPAVLLPIAILRYRSLPALALTLTVVVLALWISIGVELVLVVDDLYGSPWERMNTVFKFYVEIWLLLAVGAGVLLAWLARQLTLAISATPSVPLGIVSDRIPALWALRALRLERVVRALPYALVTVCVSLLVAGTLYPVFGTPQRLAQRLPTTPTLSLDGYAWMRGAVITNSRGEPIRFTGDYDAIAWLRDHSSSNAVVLEASIGPYRGNGARISSATGLPAVLGWDRHERQQRETPEIDQRLLDVRELYLTTDLERKRWLLRRYDVRYVVVGDVERWWRIDPPFAGARSEDERYASDEGLQAFDALVGTTLRRVFASDGTVVYEVVPFPRLPPATTEANSP